jgi:sec-independent protein translocase protein TatB
MFEVGFTEIVLILGLALLVLGPEKLPGLAQKVGRWTGRARAMARQLRTQLEHEVTMEELAKSRPMQSASQETPPQPSPPHDSHPAAHTGSGLDVDAAVSGVDPHPPSAPSGDADAAATKQ